MPVGIPFAQTMSSAGERNVEKKSAPPPKLGAVVRDWAWADLGRDWHKKREVLGRWVQMFPGWADASDRQRQEWRVRAEEKAKEYEKRAAREMAPQYRQALDAELTETPVPRELAESKDPEALQRFVEEYGIPKSKVLGDASEELDQAMATEFIGRSARKMGQPPGKVGLKPRERDVPGDGRTMETTWKTAVTGQAYPAAGPSALEQAPTHSRITDEDVAWEAFTEMYPRIAKIWKNAEEIFKTSFRSTLAGKDASKWNLVARLKAFAPVGARPKDSKEAVKQVEQEFPNMNDFDKEIFKVSYLQYEPYREIADYARTVMKSVAEPPPQLEMRDTLGRLWGERRANAPDYESIAARISKMDEKEKAVFYQVMQDEFARHAPDRGTARKIGAAFWRGVEHAAASLPAGAAAFERTASRLFTDALDADPVLILDNAKQRDKRGVRSAVRAAERAGDPITGDNALESAFIAASGMTPNLAGGLGAAQLGGPTAGVAYWTTAIAGGTYQQLLDAGFDPDKSAAVATISAVPQAMLTRLQANMIISAGQKSRILDRVIRGMAKSKVFRGTATQAAGAWAGVTTGEIAIESVQEALDATGRIVMGSLDPENMPEGWTAQQVEQYIESMKQAMLGMPVLSIMAGVQTGRYVHAQRKGAVAVRDVYSPGMTQEQQTALRNAAETGDLGKAAEVVTGTMEQSETIDIFKRVEQEQQWLQNPDVVHGITMTEEQLTKVPALVAAGKANDVRATFRRIDQQRRDVVEDAGKEQPPDEAQGTPEKTALPEYKQELHAEIDRGAPLFSDAERNALHKRIDDATTLRGVDEVQKAFDDQKMAKREQQNERRLARGKKTPISISGRNARTGQYAVMEQAHMKPSHSAAQQFARTEGYPDRLQPRNYESDPVERMKVRDIGRDIDLTRLINEISNPQEGPPTITPDGVVLAGNNRAMAMEIMPEAKAAEYKAFLAKRAEMFGLDPKTIEGMEAPRLVRVVPMKPTSHEAKAFADMSNTSSTFSMSPLRKGASLESVLGDSILDVMEGAETDTIQKVVQDPVQGRKLREALKRSVAPEELSAMFEPDGILTDYGYDVAQGALFAKVFPVQTTEGMTKSLRRTMESALPRLLEMKRRGGQYDLTENIVRILDYWNKNIAPYGKAERDQRVRGLRQENIFETTELTDADNALIETLLRYAEKPKKMRDVFEQYLNLAEEQEGMFVQAKPPHEVMRMVLPAAPEGMDLYADDPGPRPEEPPPRTVTRARDVTPKRIDQITENVDAIMGLLRPEGALRRGISRIFKAKATKEGKPPPEGAYDPTTGVGRYRKGAEGKLNVQVHEMAHHLYRAVYPDAKGDYAPREFDTAEEMSELVAYAPRDPNINALKEGYANFVVNYLFDPEQAQRRAPHSYDRLVNQLRRMPKVGAALERMGADLRTFSGAGPKAQVRATLADKLPKKYDWSALNLYAILWDKYAGINQVVKEARESGVPISPRENPLFTLMRDFDYNVSENLVGKRIVDLDGRETQNLSLMEGLIRNGVDKTELPDVEVFVDALHTLDQIDQGMDAPLPRETYQAVVDSAPSHFWQAAAALTEYARNILGVYHKGIMLSPEQYETIVQKWPHYVPQYRIERMREAATRRQKMGTEATARLGRPVKAKLGGGGTKLAPLAALAKMTRFHVHLGQRAKAYRELYRMYERARQAGVPLGKWIEKVDVPMQAQNVDLATLLTKGELEVLQESKAMQDGGAELETVRQMFMPHEGHQPMNVIIGYDNGKRFALQLNKVMYEGIASMTGPSTNIAAQSLQKLASFQRAGLTGMNLLWGLLRNIPMDFVQLMGLTKHRLGPSRVPIPGVDLMWAVAHMGRAAYNVFMKTPAYQQFRRSGGGLASITAQDINTLGIAMRRARAGERTAVEGVFDSVRHPVETFQRIVEISDQMTRFVEFSQGRKEYETKGMPKVDADILAAMDARDVTIDFRRAGRAGSRINRYWAFFNAQMQEPDKIIRRFREAPFETSLKVFNALVLPAMANWWRNKDHPYYQALAPHERDRYLWIRIPGKSGEEDTDWVRIPKPHFLGATFQTTTERIMDHVYKTRPKAMEGLGRLLAQEGLILNSPPIIAMILHGMENRKFYGAPIVPRREENLPVQERYGPRTSSLSIMLSRLGAKNIPLGAEGISPRKLDYMIGSFGGIFGDAALWLGDRLLRHTIMDRPARPARKYPEYPGVSMLHRSPHAAHGYTNELYEELNRLTKKYRGYQQTRDKRYRMTPEERRRRKQLWNRAKTLGPINKKLREIERHPRMDAERKRKIMDRIRKHRDTLLAQWYELDKKKWERSLRKK